VCGSAYLIPDGADRQIKEFGGRRKRDEQVLSELWHAND
jgi:hypothetical protein